MTKAEDQASHVKNEPSAAAPKQGVEQEELDAEILRDLEADDDVRGGSCMPTDQIH
jgi:hypothetical protein